MVGDLARRLPEVGLVLVAGTAAALLLWPMVAPDADGASLAAEVNAAYRTVPAIAAKLTTTFVVQGTEVAMTRERTTFLEGSRVVALSETTSMPDGSALYGLSTRDGIWLRTGADACWDRSTGADGARALGVGDPVVPTVGVRYESARRRGSEWTITILQEVQGNRRRTTYRIDPSTRLVRSMRMEVLAAAPLGSTTEARLTNLTVAPERPEPSPSC